MSKHFVITLGRKYGAGGGDLAKELSKRLNIPYYDKSILSLVAGQLPTT